MKTGTERERESGGARDQTLDSVRRRTMRRVQNDKTSISEEIEKKQTLRSESLSIEKITKCQSLKGCKTPEREDERRAGKEREECGVKRARARCREEKKEREQIAREVESKKR